MLCARMVAACMEDRRGPESQRYAAAPNVASAGHGREAARLSIQRAVAALSCALYGGSLPSDEKRIRTLVIDDVFDFMQTICSFLENLPNVAVIATGRTGRDAIVLAHEWMPDLVLMDIRMPEMTGLEATSQLTRELPDVIVILMTAFEDENARRASKESGAFAFVPRKRT